MGSSLPFHYWCYRTMVINMDINSGSSKCQICLSNFVLLKALDKLHKFGNCSLPKHRILLVYTCRFWCNSRRCSVQKGNRFLSYDGAPYDFLKLRSIRFFKALWVAFSHSSSNNTGHPRFTAQSFNILCLLCNSTQETDHFLWVCF